MINMISTKKISQYNPIIPFLFHTFTNHKKYIYVGGMYQVYPLLNLNIGNITNLNDGSGFINFLCTYSLTEDLYVDLGVQIVYGRELSEYWYYPVSLYLEMEYYF